MLTFHLYYASFPQKSKLSTFHKSLNRALPQLALLHAPPVQDPEGGGQQLAEGGGNQRTIL